MGWLFLSNGVASECLVPVRSFLLFALMLGPACSRLPELSLGVCGNHVFEPASGEDCDDGSAGCGVPGSANACRLICDPKAGVACPASAVCGRDLVCRQPLGSYTLGPPLGVRGERFGVGDLDGDGVPDLVGRALATLDLYHNDGAGNFTVLASGPVSSDELEAGQPVGPSFSLAPTGLGAGPLLVLADQPVGPFAVYTWADHTLTPIIIASMALPASAGRLVAAFANNGDTEAITLSATRLSAFAAAGPSPGTATERSGVDLAGLCPLDGGTAPTVHARAQPNGKGVLMFQGTSVCAALFDGLGQLQLQNLHANTALAQLGLSLGSIPSGGLVDFDGDGRLDVVLAGHRAGVTVNDRLLVWLQQATGFVATPLEIPSDTYIGDGALAGTDFDDDGREDFVADAGLYLNQTTGQGNTFAVGNGVYLQYQDFSLTSSSVVLGGDVNGDRHGDFVSWPGLGVTSLDLSYCFGDGSASRFSCGPTVPPLPFHDVQMGDVNGDSLVDLVLTGSGVGVMLGRYLSPPVSVPSPTQPLPNTNVAGTALAPLPQQIAQQLLTEVDSNGRRTIAVGRADVTGSLQFQLRQGTFDTALADFTGDGLPDLAAIVEEADDVYVSILDGAQPLHVIHAPLGLSAMLEYEVFAGFCALDPKAPPMVCGADKGYGSSFYARWNGSGYDKQMLAVPFTVFDSAQVTIDLDGDGRLESVQSLSSQGDGILRVLHVDDTGAVQVVDSSAIVCLPGNWTILDSAPFDGKLDISCNALYVQQDGFQFTLGSPGRWLQIYDSQHNPLPLPQSTGIGDFNGDGQLDALVLFSDGFYHVAFADMVRR